VNINKGEAFYGEVDILGKPYVTGYDLRVQSISATPLAVYRPAFRSPRSFADVD